MAKKALIEKQQRTPKFKVGRTRGAGVAAGPGRCTASSACAGSACA